jgi:hypothetical protein
MNSYNFLQPYADFLLEKSNSVSNLTLWHGKTGIAITLLHLSRITNEEKYALYANKLIDEVSENISTEIPFCFGNGLLGIGCGLQYIINERFMEGDSDEILSEIDQVAINIINHRPVNSLSIETGICGVGFYLYNRLKNRPKDDENIITLKLKEHLIYLIDRIEELLLETKELQDYNDTYFLLCRLQKLDVFNHKVEKLIAFCLQKIVECNCNIQDNYELLGINSLKLLKLWI